MDVVKVDLSTVCPDRLSSNRKTQAKAGSVRPAPLAKRLKRIPHTVGNTAALVFDLNQQVPLVVRPCSQHDAAASGCEFEGVVQEIGHRRCEQLWVCRHRPRSVAELDRELEPTGLGVEPASHREVTEKRGHQDARAPLKIGSDANL